MTKLIVIPQGVFDQYQADGVQFGKLLDTNYIASVSSVNDLAEIHRAIEQFPFQFCKDTDVTVVDSPLVGIALASTEPCVEQVQMRDLYNRVNSRVQTLELQSTGNAEQKFCGFMLYPVDENLWVAVQQRLHSDIGDPSRVSIEANRAFFDSMIQELLQTRSFPSVASTNLFTYYLEAQL
jgi:hypothetical protein